MVLNVKPSLAALSVTQTSLYAEDHFQVPAQILKFSSLVKWSA